MKPVDISPADLETVRRVLREHVPGLEVWAFGSRVSWTARETSDLDIALMTTEPLNVMCLAEIREAFVQSDLPFRVDIVDWSPTSKFFRRVIEQDHVMLVSKDRHNEWNETLFVNCATLVSEKVSPSEMGDVPYIGLGHIDEDTLSLRSHGIASDVTSTKTRFKRGDILFGKLRPYFRKVIMAPFDGICSTDIWVVRPLNGIDVRFLFYKMASQEFVHVATQGSEGTRMPRAKWEFVSRMSCLIPPLPEQRAIAHVLGVLDDKIELNRRMNRTLEEMARALFKSWFVDFEPVRAKVDGRWYPGESLPGLPAHLYDLFPDYFVPSELGEIPEGWQIKALRELILLAYGKALRADDRQEGTIPVYGSNGQIGWHNKKLVTGSGIIVGRKGNPGTVTWTHGDFFAIDTSFYVVPIDPALGLPFLYYALADQDLPSIAADSAVPGLNRNLAYMNIQLVPDQILVDKFGNYINGIFERRYRLEEESRSLAALRDALLPKLISRELDTFQLARERSATR